jgi:hypothetical protein
VLVILAVVAVSLHVAVWFSAGALWRDEANSVNLASAASWVEIWNNLQFDSFPMLWPLALRASIAASVGTTDAGLRGLGCLTGLLVLAALWRNARLWGGLPLASFTLCGVNAAVIRFGDSVRGFGLGMASATLAIGLVFKVATGPTRRTFTMASIASVLCVQLLYHNVIVLAAACAGGLAVARLRRSWRTAAAVVGVGLLAALSLLPYIAVFNRQREWSQILFFPNDFSWLYTKYLEALAATGPAAPWIWLICTAAAVAVGVSARERCEPIVFCTTALVCGLAAYVTFLRALSYFLQPWYFLPLFALVATCLDGITSSFRRSSRAPQGRAVAALAVAALAVAALAVAPVFSRLRMRSTNIDRVAREIAQFATPEDTVVVTPWQNGITFQRYYQGVAAWETVPPIADHRLHRFDLLKRRMMDPDAMRPLLLRIERTLKAGHRVFWVGDLQVPEDDQPVPPLPPAPEGTWGWRELPHYAGWGLQAGYVLQHLASSARRVPVATDLPVMFYENPTLVLIEGLPSETGR